MPTMPYPTRLPCRWLMMPKTRAAMCCAWSMCGNAISTLSRCSSYVLLAALATWAASTGRASRRRRSTQPATCCGDRARTGRSWPATWCSWATAWPRTATAKRLRARSGGKLLRSVQRPKGGRRSLAALARDIFSVATLVWRSLQRRIGAHFLEVGNALFDARGDRWFGSAWSVTNSSWRTHEHNQWDDHYSGENDGSATSKGARWLLHWYTAMRAACGLVADVLATFLALDHCHAWGSRCVASSTPEDIHNHPGHAAGSNGQKHHRKYGERAALSHQGKGDQRPYGGFGAGDVHSQTMPQLRGL